ncbi:MAG: retention module-containing protein [Methylophilaceae bacterium]
MAEQVNAGTKVESIGTVKTVVGEVKAVDASGVERILQAGDKVYPNETIMTAVGALVLIDFIDGSHLDLPSSSQIVLDTDVFNPANAVAQGEELTAEQIQEMIARGEDPTAVTEATAAGAGAGDEGGSSFIVVDFNNTLGNVTSGFNTLGIPGPESTTFTELPPVEDETVPVIVPPVVTVEVDVVVELPPGGGNEGGFIPVISGNNAYLPEGTDGDDAFNQVTFILRLDKAFDQDVTVFYEIRPGTATAPNASGADYLPDDGQVLDPVTGILMGFVVIPAGTTEVPVVINVVPDHFDENGNTMAEAESFQIVLTGADNATINPAANTAYGWIVDDDTSPVAVDNAYFVDEDGTLNANVILDDSNGESTGGVDNDQDGDTLTVVSFTWGEGEDEATAVAGGTIILDGIGSLTITSTGALTFIPEANYNGSVPDATYTITDGYNAPSTATIAIGINPLNDAPVDGNETNTTPEDTPLVVNSTNGVLANFSDVDGDTGTVVSFTVAGDATVYLAGQTASMTGVGTLVINANGSYTFTPAVNYNGPVPVATYTVTDGNGGTDTSTLTIDVTPLNDAPVVDPVKNVFMPDATGQMTGIYSNGYPLALNAPTDVDGDALTITVGTLPAKGTVGYVDGTGFHAVATGTTLTLVQFQSLTYKPDGVATYNSSGQGISGADDGVFTYSVSDGTASVTGTVNLHTLLGTAAHTDTVQIGDGSHPLTSGSNQTVNYIVSSEIASQGDYSQAVLQLTTDFHVRSSKNLTNAVESQVNVTLTVDGHVFTVIQANNGVNDWTQNGTNADAGGYWQDNVSFSNIVTTINGAAVSLATYLTSHPQAAGSAWIVTYDDNTGGNEQARYLKAAFINDIDGSPSVTTTGTEHGDLIYGSTNGDTLGGGSGSDTIFGREGNDILTGGTGDDILTGGAGVDTFIWKANESGTDTITDFAKGTGGDVINLADLLQGEHADANSLGSYLSFNYNNGNTTITIDTNGSTAGGDVQQVVLQGVDLTAGNTLSTTTIINNLLTDGNIKTDV